MNERHFFESSACHAVIEGIQVEGASLVCCGEPMKALKANTSDGAGEKHVPHVVREGNKLTVTIGEVEHPMVENHFIQFIMVAQGRRTWRYDLQAGEKPTAVFEVEDGPVMVYEYCNLHGLWAVEA